jgi:hypothetical protein
MTMVRRCAAWFRFCFQRTNGGDSFRQTISISGTYAKPNPHGEEARSAVSGRCFASLGEPCRSASRPRRSFETPASQAPQDEVGGCWASGAATHAASSRHGSSVQCPDAAPEGEGSTNTSAGNTSRCCRPSEITLDGLP